MDSTGLFGILIEWLTSKEQRDYNNLRENVDFTIANQYKLCPVTDGSTIDFTGAPNAENLEWLLRRDGLDVGKDLQIYERIIVSRPTQEKDIEFQNYNVWKTDFMYNRRPDDQIISVIKQLESNANMSVQSESNALKTEMKWRDVQQAMATNTPLDDNQQAVLARVTEVANRATLNADNAKVLIDLVLAGNTPDITIGWKTDNITPQSAFYND